MGYIINLFGCCFRVQFSWNHGVVRRSRCLCAVLFGVACVSRKTDRDARLCTGKEPLIWGRRCRRPLMWTGAPYAASVKCNGFLYYNLGPHFAPLDRFIMYPGLTDWKLYPCSFNHICGKITTISLFLSQFSKNLLKQICNLGKVPVNVSDIRTL